MLPAALARSKRCAASQIVCETDSGEEVCWERSHGVYAAGGSSVPGAAAGAPPRVPDGPAPTAPAL